MDEIADVREPPATSQPALSPSEAGRMLASLRRGKEPDAPAPESNAAAPPARVERTTESPAQAEDAAPPPEATGETQAADPEPTEAPLIEPPRSWSKDARERWTNLDPDTQQYLLDRDRQDSAAVKRAQNETAEKAKALTAKEQAVEQARQQYESALPILLSNLQSGMAGEFADIKTMADVQRMSKEDWPRYIAWDAAQKQVAAVHQEMQAAQHRQDQDKRQKWNDFATKEERALVDLVPEMGDPDKASKLQKSAMSYLADLGFSNDELAQSWNGQGDLSLRDHRLQMLIIDGVKWRDAQSKAKSVTAKPLPPVQRPGTQRAPGADASRIAQLESQLDSGKLTVKQQLEVAAQLRSMKAPLMARRA